MIPLHMQAQARSRERQTLKKRFLEKLLSTRKGIAKLQTAITAATRKLTKSVVRPVRKTKGATRKGTRKGLRKSRT